MKIESNKEAFLAENNTVIIDDSSGDSNGPRIYIYKSIQIQVIVGTRAYMI
jgi:hypothetical protein